MKRICTNKQHVGENPLEIKNFNKKGKTNTGVQRYQSWCSECNKRYLKEHYSKDPVYYANKRDDWRNNNKQV